MSATRTILDFTITGAVLGVVVASLVVPPVLGWYNTPGNIGAGKPIETLCNVPELIRYATRHLLVWQLIGAGLGALVFLPLGVRRSRRSSLSSSAVTTR